MKAHAWTVILCVALFAGSAQAEPRPGTLLLPQVLNSAERDRIPGFVQPRVWIYNEAGEAVGANGSAPQAQGYSVGERLELPQGWYLVEVGTLRAPENRIKLYIKSRRVTVIPTGLIVVTAEPAAAQPRDTCTRWSGKLQVSLPIGDSDGIPISNNGNESHHPVGAIQVVAGQYRIHWNRFHLDAEVKPNQAYNIPTGLLGPMEHTGYTLHRREGVSADNPGLRLCSQRPTRVLAGTYWGSWNRTIANFPFKQRQWEELTIGVDIQTDDLYQRLPVPEISGRRHRGNGSQPARVVPSPEEDPSK